MERNKALAGFTLAEILVVLFIISLLSALTFANYRQGGKEMALQRAASKLAQDIRRAQEMAIGAIESKSTSCSGTIPTGGYGIILKTTPSSWKKYYILFADCDGDNDYDEPGELEEQVYFEGGVEIDSFSPSVNPPGVRKIIFRPPDPEVRIDPGNLATSSIALILGGQTKVIFINKAGLIEIQ
jgi:prepilin-type N-terminal cleavage/methylation domain-containing protein